MSEPNLSDAEIERLAVLIEEASEVVQCATKILRHGYESFNPDDVEAGDNRGQLCREIGDVQYAVELMHEAGDVDRSEIAYGLRAAAVDKPKYLHHQQGADLNAVRLKAESQ